MKICLCLVSLVKLNAYNTGVCVCNELRFCFSLYALFCTTLRYCTKDSLLV